MATKHPRINIALDKELRQALNFLASRRDLSVSAAASQLLREAVEADEDYYLAKLADRRAKETGKRIPHAKAWPKA